MNAYSDKAKLLDGKNPKLEFKLFTTLKYIMVLYMSVRMDFLRK